MARLGVKSENSQSPTTQSPSSIQSSVELAKFSAFMINFDLVESPRIFTNRSLISFDAEMTFNGSSAPDVHRHRLEEIPAGEKWKLIGHTTNWLSKSVELPTKTAKTSQANEC